MVKMPLSLAACWAACMVTLASAMTPVIQNLPSGSAGAETTIDTLKQVYLVCERAAAKGDLDTGEIMRCAVVYEELKRRAFGGEFRRLKTWADAQTSTEGY